MKHLIFDCGGVLVYPRLGEWNLPFGAAQILGPRAKDLFSAKYLIAHRQAAQWLDEGRLVADVEEERRLRREYIRALDDAMGWNLSAVDILRLSDDFTDNIRRYALFNDVKPWLLRWKARYSLGMLSDAMPSILDFMRQFGISECFDAMVISTQVGATKPDPRMYAAILEALNADAQDCLFVDDRVDNLEGAMAAGMNAVQMARSAFLPKQLWKGPVVRDFEALNRMIEA